MFRKILIAEDIDSIGFGLETIIKQLHGAEIVQARYCDEALLKIKRALYDNEPFDLLLSDLSFTPDHRDNRIMGGEDLANEVRKVQPDIKIIIHSIEDRIYKIRSLFETTKIDGFVWKGRNGTTDLLRAMQMVSGGNRYLSDRFSHILDSVSALEITEQDIKLIQMIANGYTQMEISEQFKSAGLSSSSSSIEKNINRVRIVLRAKNSMHLVSIAKDLGII